MTNEKKGMLASLAGNSIFGFSFMFSKIALDIASPLTLLATRFIIAFGILNVLLWLGKGSLNLRGKDIKSLILLGLCQPVLYFICENYGLRLTNSVISGVMTALIPVASLSLAVVFLQERATVLQVIFTFFSIGGVVLVTLEGNSDGIVTLVGILFLLGAVLSQAFYNIFNRRVAEQFTVFERTYLMFLMGSIFFFCAALFENRGDLYGGIIKPFYHPGYLPAVLYLAAVSSVGAFYLLNYAAAYLTVARTSAFANIATIVSILVGVLILHENFNLIYLIGSFMIIAGVYMVNKEGTKERN